MQSGGRTASVRAGGGVRTSGNWQFTGEMAPNEACLPALDAPQGQFNAHLLDVLKEDQLF